jgi:uncharacterized protein (TIGR02453 family)
MSTQSFSGFPPGALDFLRGLAANNNREWFEAHKADYQTEIVAHAPAFVAELGERLRTISPEIAYDTRTNGAGSMMRIYRDTRFSQDKTPYKTHVAFAFWEGGLKKMENPSFGLQFGANDIGFYAGQWVFPKESLSLYRQAVVAEGMGQELVAAAEAVRQAGPYVVQGEQYKKVPPGYPTAHSRAEWLRFGGLYVIAEQTNPASVTSSNFIDHCFEHFRNMAPVQRWLVKLTRK